MRALPIATHFRWTFNNSFEASEVQSGKYSYNGTHSTLNYRAESNQVWRNSEREGISTFVTKCDRWG